MKILFAYRAFNNVAGGVQKMCGALMNEMVRRGHEVELITWDKPETASFFPLDEKIIWHKVGIGSFKQKASLVTRLKRAVAVRKIVRNFSPDSIIAYQDGMFMAMYFYTFGMSIPVIAAERNAPSRFDFIQSGRYKHLLFNAFRLSRVLAVQCPSYIQSYPSYLRNKIVVIPNPVSEAASHAHPEGKTSSRKILLSVGRLGYQKNYDVLLDAFILIADDYSDWDLVIVGEGDDRVKLLKKIEQANLSNRILLPGASNDVSSYYRKSHLFCLPSRWEGFPNALAEAMAHGLPAVGFQDCAGTSDLIEDGITGLLAKGNENSRSLSQSLVALIKDGELRAEMGKASINAMKEFRPDLIYNRWEELFKETGR